MSPKANTAIDTKLLTAEMIRDYAICPLYYRFKYEDERYEEMDITALMSERYINTFRKALSFFFYKKQNGTVPSYTALLNRWEKMWFPKDITAYDLAIQQNTANNSLSSYSVAATLTMKVFHDDFKNDQGIPVAIMEPFLAPIRHDIRLQGQSDLILKYPNGGYRVIQWMMEKKPNQKAYYPLDLAAQKVGFEHRLSPKLNVEYQVYDLHHETRSFADIDQPTYVEVNQLKYWAGQIADSDDRYPRRGFTRYCRGCPFDEECLGFKDWPQT